MKKIIIGVLVLALLAGGAYVSLGRGGTPVADPAPTKAELAVKAIDQVVAEAKVVPSQSVALSFPISGVVAAILVAEGDQVAAGVPLARLDTRALELRLAQAQVALAQAGANYDKLVERATPEEIAAAEAQVMAAEANLRQTQGNVTQQDLAAARAALEQARASLARLEAGPKTTQVQSAQATLVQAHTRLQAQRDSLSTAKSNAQLQLEQAANTVRDRQADYSRIMWDNQQLKNDLASVGQTLPQAAIDQAAAALRAVQNAEAAMGQAQLAYDQAQLAEQSGIASAEAEVAAAQAGLDQLLAGADADQLAAARAQVAQAQANLTKQLGNQRAGSVEAAAANVTSAQANLAKLKADPRASDLAIAKAQVQAAEVSLKEARLALEQATLRAPMAGTVAELNLKVGELPSASSAVVVLADLATWQIETSDLTELNVVRLNEGDQVTISFDALPGVALPGTISRIKPIGKNSQGDIVYTVVVKPTQHDARLRWNMTAAVSITAR